MTSFDKVMPPQPLHVAFQPRVYYRLSRAKVKVEAIIMIADELYGPYPTEIKADRLAWQIRRKPVEELSIEAKQLNQDLYKLRLVISQAWSQLNTVENNETRIVITGEMIARQAGLVKPQKPVLPSPVFMTLSYYFSPTVTCQRVSKGTIELCICLGSHMWGRFQTGIRTNDQIWAKRLLQDSSQAQRLRDKLSVVDAKLRAAWDELQQEERQQKRVFADGGAIWERAGYIKRIKAAKEGAANG